MHVILLLIIMYIWQTDQRIKCLGVDKAGELAGNDPDYGIKDLYEAIASNNFVSIMYTRNQFRICFLWFHWQ